MSSKLATLTGKVDGDLIAQGKKLWSRILHEFISAPVLLANNSAVIRCKTRIEKAEREGRP